VRWPDFRLPTDPADAREAFVEAYARAASTRVEVACGGGRGRTGTALACLCVLAGLSADAAIALVRTGYHRRAIETPGQRRFIRRFAM
jgi:protein-tyrosine phosphatase